MLLSLSSMQRDQIKMEKQSLVNKSKSTGPKRDPCGPLDLQ